MEELGVPGFFVGDLNSYRSLETKVYSTCLAYFDDAWVDYPLSEQMCTFHDYGGLLGNPTATNPNNQLTTFIQQRATLQSQISPFCMKA